MGNLSSSFHQHGILLQYYFFALILHVNERLLMLWRAALEIVVFDLLDWRIYNFLTGQFDLELFVGLHPGGVVLMAALLQSLYLLASLLEIFLEQIVADV